MSNPLQDMLDNIYKKLRLPYYSAPVLCEDCDVAYPTRLIDEHYSVCIPRRDRLDNNPLLLTPDYRKLRDASWEDVDYD